MCHALNHTVLHDSDTALTGVFFLAVKKVIPASNAVFRLTAQTIVMPWMSESVSEFTNRRGQMCIGLGNS